MSDTPIHTQAHRHNASSLLSLLTERYTLSSAGCSNNRSAKRHANRKTLRMAGDNGNGDGNEDAHGDRSGKSARCAVFATWLLDTFGAATLAAGTGVIDVAGGRGELSFELAVKRAVPTTLLDPRHPGKLSKAQR